MEEKRRKKGEREKERAEGIKRHEKTGERGEKRVRVEKRQASRSKYQFVHTTLMYSMYVSVQYLPADIFLNEVLAHSLSDRNTLITKINSCR